MELGREAADGDPLRGSRALALPPAAHRRRAGRPRGRGAPHPGSRGRGAARPPSLGAGAGGRPARLRGPAHALHALSGLRRGGARPLTLRARRARSHRGGGASCGSSPGRRPDPVRQRIWHAASPWAPPRLWQHARLGRPIAGASPDVDAARRADARGRLALPASPSRCPAPSSLAPLGLVVSFVVPYGLRPIPRWRSQWSSCRRELVFASGLGDARACSVLSTVVSTADVATTSTTPPCRSLRRSFCGRRLDGLLDAIRRCSTPPV